MFRNRSITRKLMTVILVTSGAVLTLTCGTFLVYELVTMQDLSEVWKVAQTKEQPAATYVARMVEIESERPVDDGVPVQTRELAVGVR